MGKTLSKKQLQIKSSCDGLDDSLLEVGDPDLLDWELVEWKISDGTTIKEYSAYPCNSDQIETLDVLMAYGAADLYDAVDTSNVLGCKMGPPKSEKDTKRMISEAKDDVAKSDCAGYLWLPYKRKKKKSGHSLMAPMNPCFKNFLRSLHVWFGRRANQMGGTLKNVQLWVSAITLIYWMLIVSHLTIFTCVSLMVSLILT